MVYRNISIFFFFLIGLAVACERPPEFEPTPLIKRENIRYIGTEQGDTIKIKFRFQDGNGDLGLTKGDTLPPFQLWNGPQHPDCQQDSCLNLDYYNILIDLFTYDSAAGEFVPFQFPPPRIPTQNLHGRFPPFKDSENSSVDDVEGTIEYKFGSLSSQFPQPGDSVRVDVRIKDRSLNTSNKLEFHMRAR